MFIVEMNFTHLAKRTRIS